MLVDQRRQGLVAAGAAEFDLCLSRWRDRLGKLILIDCLQEHGAIQHKDLVHQLGVELLQFEDDLPVRPDRLLVVDVFQLRVLHVNNQQDLVNSFFVDEFSAVCEFHPPGVLHFLNKEMNQHVQRILNAFHKFLELHLADLHDENRPALAVHAMESMRQRRLYAVVLREFEILLFVNRLDTYQYRVNFHVLAPFHLQF